MKHSAAGADVVIVGGGVIGCAVAYFAALDGHRVHLLERAATLAAEASGAAAGMLAPLSEASAAGPLLRWGLAGLAELPMLCEELHADCGVDAEFRASGLLRVASSASEARSLEARLAQLRDVAPELRWLDRDALQRERPELAPALHGALVSPREANLRSPLLAQAMARAAELRGGRIECGRAVHGLCFEGDRVVGVETAAGAIAADQVVVCSGSWAGELDGWLPSGAPKLPIEPLRGQILALRPEKQVPATIVWGEAAYLVPKRDGSVVVGATQERVGFDKRVTAAGVAQLREAATALWPALGAAPLERAWAGLRPGSPDELPAIGAVGPEGLIVAVGHHRNGVLLSSVTGRLVADLLAGRALPAAAADFSPLRFGA